MRIYVSTSLHQIATNESSFFKTTSGIHHRLFEGRHLVLHFFFLCFYRTLVVGKDTY